MTEGGFITRSTINTEVSSGSLTEEMILEAIKSIQEYQGAPYHIVSPKRYKEIMDSPELRRLFGVKDEI